MGAAVKLDYLVTLLNINAAPCEINIPGTGPVKLSTSDVYGALGMGNLSSEAKIIGLAYYCKDAAMIREARNIGVKFSKRAFDRENWSATDPFKKQVNDLVRAGTLPKELAASEKHQRGEQLKVRIGFTAINELIQGALCQHCHGSGWIQDKYVAHEKHVLCSRCCGLGRSRFTVSDVARRLALGEDAARKTWYSRFIVISYEVKSELNKFEYHLEQRIGR